MRKLQVAVICISIALGGCSRQTKESLFEQGTKQLNGSNPSGAVVYFKNALEHDPNFTEARLQLAKAYAASGRLEQAEREFTKVQSQNPSRDEVTLELAKLFNETRRAEQAFKLAKEYLAKHRDSVEALQSMARSCEVKKSYGDAEHYLLQALTLAPNNTTTILALAAVNIKAGSAAKARPYLDRVILSEPGNIRALYMLAALQQRNGDYDQAVSSYRRILAANPSEITAEYKLGLINLEKGDMGKAGATAEALIKRFPARDGGYRLKGLVGFYLKNYTEAIANLLIAQKKSPTLEGEFFLGLCYYHKGLLESALAQFRLILDRAPDSRLARLMVGQISINQNMPEDAVGEIKKVIAANDSDAVAHELLGTAYLALGQFTEGIHELDRATMIDPKMATAHAKKGYYYLSNGRNSEGETELVTAIKAAPGLLDNRLLLAAYYQRQGNTVKARSVLVSGLSGGKSDAPLYNGMASLNFSGNNVKEGVENLEQAKKADPAFAASYLNLAAYFGVCGDYQKAMEQYGALLKIDGRNTKALLGLAAVYELSGRDGDALTQYRLATREKAPEAFLAQAAYHAKKGETDKALKVLDEAVQLDSHAMAPLAMKAQLLIAARKYREALLVSDQVERLKWEAGVRLKTSICLAMRDFSTAAGQAQRLIDDRPHSASGYLMLASVYESRKDLPRAISEVKKGIKVDGKSVEARLRLGDLLKAANELDLAMAAYQGALTVKPGSADVLFSQAALLDQRGRKKEAIRTYRAILERSDGFVPALNNLALLYADGYGDKGEALQLAISALRREPGNAGIMDTVGYALLKSGRKAEALKALERSAALLPKDPTVRYHLALAYRDSGDTFKAQQSLKRSLELGTCAETEAARSLLAALPR